MKSALRSLRSPMLALGACAALAGCRSSGVPVTAAERKAQLEQQIQKVQNDPRRTPEEKERDAQILRSLAAESRVGSGHSDR